MAIPTRFIEKDEFDDLMAQEGNVLPLFKLTALPFNPPTPDGPAMQHPELNYVNVLLVNVAEPCLFRDKEANIGFILMNGYDTDGTFTYENFEDCHTTKGAWAYRLSPSYWDEGDWEDHDLSDAVYRFNHGEIPAWELGN